MITYAQIKRRSTIYDNSVPVDTVWTTLAPLHKVELVELSERERVFSDVMKIESTHTVFTRLRDVDAIAKGDHYFIDSDKYQITGKFADDFSPYFRVIFDDFARENASSVSRIKRFSLKSIGPDSYSFGSGLFGKVVGLSGVPKLLALRRNGGSFYVQSLSTTGLNLRDTGIGDVPVFDITLFDSLSDSWSVSGLGAGSYTYGSGALASVTASFSEAPGVFCYSENGAAYAVTNQTVNGFTIIDSGFGDDVSVTAVIVQRTPDNGELRWIVDNVPSGVHSFGAGYFASVPVSANTVKAFTENNSLGGHWVSDINSAGMTIVDDGSGDAPLVTVMIIPGG